MPAEDSKISPLAVPGRQGYRLLQACFTTVDWLRPGLSDGGEVGDKSGRPGLLRCCRRDDGSGLTWGVRGSSQESSRYRVSTCPTGDERVLGERKGSAPHGVSRLLPRLYGASHVGRINCFRRWDRSLHRLAQVLYKAICRQSCRLHARCAGTAGQLDSPPSSNKSSLRCEVQLLATCKRRRVRGTSQPMHGKPGTDMHRSFTRATHGQPRSHAS